MKILALESSAVAASVALTEDDVLLAQSFQNSGLTHSRTLMPLCEDLLKNIELTLNGKRQALEKKKCFGMLRTFLCMSSIKSG